MEAKWTKKKILIYGLLTIIALMLIKIGRKMEEKIERTILEDCTYTIGTVTSFHLSSSSSPELKYNYIVDGIEIEGRRYYKYIPYEYYKNPPQNSKEKELFVVAYSNNNVKKCLLLFDYPIKQEGDFDKYLDNFKVNPPRIP